MKRITLLLMIFALTYNVNAQSNEKKQSKLEEYNITIKVGDEIKEHDEYLLRNELKSSEYVIKYIDINHINKTVEFIGDKKHLKNYTDMLDKYFTKYEIYINGNLYKKNTIK